MQQAPEYEHRTQRPGPLRNGDLEIPDPRDQQPEGADDQGAEDQPELAQFGDVRGCCCVGVRRHQSSSNSSIQLSSFFHSGWSGFAMR